MRLRVLIWVSMSMISDLPDCLHEVKINDYECRNTASGDFYLMYITLYYKDCSTDDYNYLSVTIDTSPYSGISVVPETTDGTLCIDLVNKLEWLKSIAVLYAVYIFSDVFESVDMSEY